MQVIMTNPTERDMIRMRQDAEIDRRTELNSAERRGERRGVRMGISQGKIEMARGMKRDGVDPVFISKYSGLTMEEIAAL